MKTPGFRRRLTHAFAAFAIMIAPLLLVGEPASAEIPTELQAQGGTLEGYDSSAFESYVALETYELTNTETQLYNEIGNDPGRLQGVIERLERQYEEGLDKFFSSMDETADYYERLTEIVEGLPEPSDFDGSAPTWSLSYGELESRFISSDQLEDVFVQEARDGVGLDQALEALGDSGWQGVIKRRIATYGVPASVKLRYARHLVESVHPDMALPQVRTRLRKAEQLHRSVDDQVDRALEVIAEGTPPSGVGPEGAAYVKFAAQIEALDAMNEKELGSQNYRTQHRMRIGGGAASRNIDYSYLGGLKFELSGYRNIQDKLEGQNLACN